jgi:hypothetical protein
MKSCEKFGEKFREKFGEEKLGLIDRIGSEKGGFGE